MVPGSSGTTPRRACTPVKRIDLLRISCIRKVPGIACVCRSPPVRLRPAFSSSSRWKIARAACAEGSNACRCSAGSRSLAAAASILAGRVQTAELSTSKHQPAVPLPFESALTFKRESGLELDCAGSQRLPQCLTRDLPHGAPTARWGTGDQFAFPSLIGRSCTGIARHRVHTAWGSCCPIRCAPR